jgi:hypothetical protein
MKNKDEKHFRKAVQSSERVILKWHETNTPSDFKPQTSNLQKMHSFVYANKKDFCSFYS